MRFDIFTLFPEMFIGPFQESIIKRALEHDLVQIAIHDIRAYATDRHHTADDTPYGGGGGMVMKPEPVFAAVEDVLGEAIGETPIVLLTPQGRRFTQPVARDLARKERLALICGHYEGVDERVRQHLATDEVSIGDYVLTGGELPAMVIVDAVTRLLSGVLGDPSAAEADSYATGLLEHPHYTRPYDFRGWTVPDTLLSGHHAEVERWRRREALRRTWERRPDLLDQADLTEDDLAFLAGLGQLHTDGKKHG
ncbi:MAG: tRNA (guanosine(37)-N1)-methyltransferase TrmD [Anaerolineae bacterium]